MTQAVVSSGVSEFLLTNGTELIAKNSRAAELPQASAHLPHGVLTGIPRPVEGRQRDGGDISCEELQQRMGDTQKERPAADALSRATLIVTQTQFFDFIEVDFDLAAAHIGVDCLYGIEGEVSTEQVPRHEGQPGNSDNHHAGGQRAVGPHATQEDVGSTDRDRTGTAPDAQEGTVLQVLRKLGEQPIHTTGGAEDTGRR
jgi:hypothetical protein